MILREEISLEQWGHRAIEIAQKALGVRDPGVMLQEQAVFSLRDDRFWTRLSQV